MRTDLLTSIPLFRGLPNEAFKHLASTLQVLSLEPGTILFRQGEIGESFYIIITGQLEVVLGIDTSNERILSECGPGEFLGEVGLIIPDKHRTASVRARTRSQLWEMTRHDFDVLLHQHPHLAYTMVEVLGSRLSSSNNAAFQELLEKNRELHGAYNELKAAQAQIIEKERLEKELQLAASIQMSILPFKLPVLPGVDFGARIQPARTVGGDLYDIFRIDDHHVGILIGDVADKGIPSAIFMARTHALITAEALRTSDPSVVLHQVNRYLTRLDQSDLFVTVIYGVYDVWTGRFVYARAGHEVPLLYRPGQVVEALPRGAGQPIGIFEDILVDEKELEIPPGGMLLLYTDGLTDCRDPNGEAMGRERAEAEFKRLVEGSSQKACDELINTLQEYQAGMPQDDDVTLVVIKRTQ